MFTTVYVVGFEPNECAWVRSALGRSVQAVVNVEDGAALLAQVSDGPDQCVIASADVAGAATLALVRELRRRGLLLPVIVLGPHSEFRTAVDIARLDATDFLERPVSARELRAALRRIRSDPHSQY